MCGIAGIIDFKSDKSNDRGLLLKMIDLIRHRGPDATGIYVKGPAGLAHARLSIIDLSGGDQPIHNEDKTVWIVFNGEIFNYPELRADLEARGHQFYTQSDTEVLVHMYEEFGTDMFRSLNGQFAFAIWDNRKQELLLARDRVGIRPLFYHQDGSRLLFGSEVKAIFADPNVPRCMDLQTLRDVFTCWAPLDGATSFEGIRQLPAAHFAVFTHAGLKVQPFWRLLFSPEGAVGDPEPSLSDWIEGLSELLVDATRIRLRADVSVGAYLSGGIDSTLTSSIVKRNFNNLLRTFSVSFADSRFDETSFQATAVNALKTDHSQVRCTDQDIGTDFPKVVWHSEVPLLRTAPAPLYRLSRLVRENNFKVVLTGEGADEMFAGYNIFKEDKVRRFWARNPDSQMRPRLLSKLYPYIFEQGGGKSAGILECFFKRGLTETSSPVYSHMVRWNNTAQLHNFFSAGTNNGDGLSNFTERYAAGLPEGFMSWHPLSRAQYTEIRVFLTNYLLSSQGDRMAMANAVEGRYPFLDYRVVEYAARIPPRFKLNGLTEKFVLKKLARDYVPKELIDRPKHPYRAPISGCFFNDKPPEYVAEMLSETCIKKAGYFDAAKVEKLAAKCEQRAGQLLSERENMALVGILSTQLLHQLFIEEFPSASSRQPLEAKVYA
jgi:asparagine synthase (glutamine-hydrolysing)